MCLLTQRTHLSALLLLVSHTLTLALSYTHTCARSIQIKSFRGNVEAQFTRSASRVQLLYRRDRYFNTRDVSLTTLYPMIEWYKQHRREFFLVDSTVVTSSSSSSSINIGGDSSERQDTALVSSAAASLPPTRHRTKIRDLREHMVATVLCRVRELKPSEAAALGAQLARPSARSDATDFDGALLREVVMQDHARDWMVVNLWDQHAEAKSVARVLAHRGLVELRGVVVSLNALSSRLLANTTPQTQIFLIDAAAAANDAEVHAIERSLGLGTSPVKIRPAVYTSLDALESVAADTATGADDSIIVVVDSVCIERICLASRVFSRESSSSSRSGEGDGDSSSSSRDSCVLPQRTPLLVESVCSVCEDVLPERTPGAVPLQYSACVKRCRARRGTSDRRWRYRPGQIVLRDAHGQRLQLPVEQDALIELLGNIQPEMLAPMPSGGSASPPPFDVKSAVAALLNALVDDRAQTFRAEIRVTQIASQGGGDSQRSRSSSTGGLSQDTQQQQSPSQRVSFTLASLGASPKHRLVLV